MACSDDSRPAYAELAAATSFSFLHGASQPADMVTEAVALCHKGLGIADRNTVAGVVRAWRALRDLHDAGHAKDFRLFTGARLVFADETPDIIAYPVNRRGWGRLTRLLSLGNLRTDKGNCLLYFADLAEWCEEMALIVLPDRLPPAPAGTAPLGGSPLAAKLTLLANRTPYLW